jgi:hypothetical protein
MKYKNMLIERDALQEPWEGSARCCQQSLHFFMQGIKLDECPWRGRRAEVCRGNWSASPFALQPAHRCRPIAASPNHVHPGSWISILLAEHASADRGSDSARKQSWVSKGPCGSCWLCRKRLSFLKASPVFVTLVNIASVRESAGTYDRYCGYEDVTKVRFPVCTLARALAVRGVVGLRAKGLGEWDRLDLGVLQN